jgi:hypothetical protein
MKKNLYIGALLASAAFVAVYVLSVGVSPVPAVASDEQWMNDKAAVLERLDRHIVDIQKRYDCVAAAAPDDFFEKCNRERMPERDCP